MAIQAAKTADTTLAELGNESPAVVKLVRVPNNLLGTLLDHGTASAYAVHVLGFKLLHGNGWSLNEQRLAKPVVDGGIEMGERKLRKALALAKRQKVLERRKGGRRPNGKRAYAKEKLAPGGDHYVDLPESLVRSSDSKLVSFVAATLLAPFPQDARDLAKRIGVSPKSPNTIKRLVQGAVAGQYIAAERVGSRWIVARPSVNLAGFKNVAIQNVAIKNVANHSNLEDSHSDLKERTLGDARRSSERRSPDVDFKIEDATKIEPKWIILSDWKASSHYSDRLANWDRMLPWLKNVPPVMNNAIWRKWITRFGGAPDHLLTPGALVQANEAAHFLHCCSKGHDYEITPLRALTGLAFALHAAAAQGRRIRSIAFVVQRLETLTLAGCVTWAYDFPSILPKDELDEAATIATNLVLELEGDGFPLIRRELLGTDGIEAVAARIRRFGLGAVMVGVRDAINHKRRPVEGRTVIGWSWFDDAIEAALPHDQPR